MHGVKNNKFMLTLDLTLNYQIPINEADISKTAFIVPSSSYAFKRIFGSTGYINVFMVNVLQLVLAKFSLLYLNNIIVVSEFFL